MSSLLAVKAALVCVSWTFFFNTINVSTYSFVAMIFEMFSLFAIVFLLLERVKDLSIDAQAVSSFAFHVTFGN
jgi:hypothetical protein